MYLQALAESLRVGFLYRVKDNSVILYHSSFFLFSQGGFARVYEVTDMSTNKVYALKAVPKAKLTKSADRYNKVRKCL